MNEDVAKAYRQRDNHRRYLDEQAWDFVQWPDNTKEACYQRLLNDSTYTLNKQTIKENHIWW